MLVAFIMLALGVKLWFDPNAEFSSHSCGSNDSKPNKDSTGSMCQLKDLSDCTLEKESQLETKLYKSYPKLYNTLIDNLL